MYLCERGPMRKLPFVKMHGCGNDYVYVVADQIRPADPAGLARRISDRRFGIGGDGLIMLCPAADADVRMEMYNADGSRGEMCGNGIRCLARLHYETAGGGRNPLAVETDCGIKTVSLTLGAPGPVAATVDMGGQSIDAIISGTIEGDSMRGTMVMGAMGSFDFTGTRPR